MRGIKNWAKVTVWIFKNEIHIQLEVRHFWAQKAFLGAKMPKYKNFLKYYH